MKRSEFKHGDVVRAVEGSYVGIITTERTSAEGPCFMATWWPENIPGGSRWECHPGAYTSGEVELHPDPEAIWADYIRACLMGEVVTTG